MRISDWSSDVCSSDLWLALILFNWTYIEHGHWSFWNTIISTHNLSFFLGIAAYWISSRASLKSRGLPLLVAGICLLLVACSLDPGVAEGPEIRFTYNIRSEEHTSELQSLMRIS